MPTSVVASAGSLALSATRGSHPATRLDSFLRSTDVSYQHAEASTHGDHFIRKMSTYGSVRPSSNFISEARAKRPFNENGSVGMSSLPPAWMDPRGEEKEGTFEVPAPPAEIDTSFVDLYANNALMLPSERYREHLQIKAAEKKWREDRDASFLYKKRMNILETSYPAGIVGVDGPLHPETKLWAGRRSHMVQNSAAKAQQAEGRCEHLHAQARADDATAMRGYGTDPGVVARSRDIGIPRRRVDPEAHPFRFMDTHDRLFPSYNPSWDPSRAYMLRSHDVRDKTHNIITGVGNTIDIRVSMPHGVKESSSLPGMPQSSSNGGGVAAALGG